MSEADNVTLETLEALNRTLGKDRYHFISIDEAAGERVIVRTIERPGREWSAQFARGLTVEQKAAVWQEFVARVAGSPGNPVDAPPGPAGEPAAGG